MTPDRWSQISSLLDQVFAHPSDEWEQVLDRICDDRALRTDVEALLEAEREAPAVLDAGAAPYVSTLLPDTESDACPEPDVLSPGQMVGPYEIGEEIGRGGMSVVYRADRTDGPFTRTVALKVLRSSLNTDSVQRFSAERHILASLDHPNIGRIFDGGTTADGRPYFAMEYVEGRPITEYCDAHQLTIEERINLFRTVAETVQYAHQSLVIHRDLKPSNILVQENAGSGSAQVKLLDFGIAKVLDAGAPASLAGPTTRTGHHLMTPEYAAPEQVKGDAVTTATDVYALGILLYELLTGRRPYRLQQRSPYDVVRAVCETDPTRPSTAVTTEREDSAPSDISSARSTDVQQLKRRLRGDLDAIILKALRKDPEARYDTVSALTADLEAYEEGRPVEAHVGSWTYRLGKFLQRRRTSVASGVLILLLLVGYAVTVTVQANRIRAERDKAEAVTSFLVDLFEGSDPLRAAAPPSADSLSLRTILDRGARRVRTEMTDQPATRAELLSVMGQVYTHTGHYPRADSLLRSALDVQREAGTISAEDRAQTKQTLAYSRFRQDRYEEAEALYREALSLLRQQYGPDDPRLAPVMNGLAMVLDERGDPAEAETLYRRLIDLNRTTGDSVAATYLHNLALTLERQNRFEEAIAMHENALSAYRAEHGDQHPSVANALARMAFTHQRAGRLDTAEVLHRQALDLRRELLPPNHPHLASSLVRFGWLLVEQGAPQKAEPLAREGLAILESILPENHWQIEAARGVLGLSWATQGRLVEGVPLVETYYETVLDRFGIDDWRTQSAARALVRLYQTWGKPAKAAAIQRTLKDASSSKDTVSTAS